MVDQGSGFTSWGLLATAAGIRLRRALNVALVGFSLGGGGVLLYGAELKDHVAAAPNAAPFELIVYPDAHRGAIWHSRRSIGSRTPLTLGEEPWTS